MKYQQWEYTTIDDDAQKLKELGKAGWELVSTVNFGETYQEPIVHYLKRPLIEDK